MKESKAKSLIYITSISAKNNNSKFKQQQDIKQSKMSRHFQSKSITKEKKEVRGCPEINKQKIQTKQPKIQDITERYGKISEVEKIKPSIKNIQTIYDEVEQKLKSRELTTQQLTFLASQKLFSLFAIVYYEYQILWQQTSRIILQIYSHYQIRSGLYNSDEVRSYIIPFLVFSSQQLNDCSSSECIKWLLTQGKLQIIENMKIAFWPPIVEENGKNKYQLEEVIEKNVKIIMKKYLQKQKKKLISIILSEICLKITDSYEKKEGQGLKRSKSKENQGRKGFQLTLKFIVEFITQQNFSINKERVAIQEEQAELFFRFIRLYVDFQAINFPVCANKGNNKSQVQLFRNSLLYKWFILSSCNKLTIYNYKGKVIKIKNQFRLVFQMAVDYLSYILNQNNGISLHLNRNFSQITDNEKTVKHSQIINFIFSVCYPLAIEQEKNPIYSNEVRTLLVVQRFEYFIAIITFINLQQSSKEEDMEIIVKWLFQLAVFCDQNKKNHILDPIIKSINNMGFLERQVNFNEYQSILYRLLICIQKCLPKYSLKFYEKQYINHPGIFHLYFIDEILKYRQPYEVLKFLVQMVQRWSPVDNREFNLLGYICKFITRYLKDQSEDPRRQYLDILLTFFRELSPNALTKITLLFYQSSFSEQPFAHFISSEGAESSETKEKTLPFAHSSSSPPLTLSNYQSESQLKSCGYFGYEKSIFIDRNFYIGEQLLNWQFLLRQVNNDDFYFYTKYFFYLLTSAYKLESPEPQTRQSTQLKNITNINLRLSINSIQPRSSKIEKVIEIWTDSLRKNSVTEIYSIFHIIACLIEYGQNQKDREQNKIFRKNNIFSKKQMQSIVCALLQNNEKLLNLPNIWYLNWHEYLKDHMKVSEVLDSYKREESKIKNKHLFFLRSVVHFIENLGEQLISFLPTQMGYQQIIEIIQKFAFYGGDLVCLRSVRILSQKISQSKFICQGILAIKNAISSQSGRNLRKKFQLYRQLIFTLLETESGKIMQTNINKDDNSKNSKISMQSQKSNSSKRSIESLMENELKLKEAALISDCIQTLSNSISNVKEGRHQLMNEKQQLCIKILAFQIINEVFIRALTNKSSMKIVLALTIKKSKEKRNDINKNQILNNLAITLNNILFRDVNILGKYERKLILRLRSFCLNFIVSDDFILLNQYFSKSNIIDSLFTVQQQVVVLWHLAIDEDIELRIQLLNILTSGFKGIKFSIIQSQLYYVSSILILIAALEPKPKLKFYSRKYIRQILRQIETGNQGGFLVGLALTICFFLFNSRVSLPFFDIFEQFCDICLQNNRQAAYMLISTLSQLQRNGYIFQQIKMKGNSFVGQDLKTYYMNVKNRRGWYNSNKQSDGKEVKWKKFQFIVRQLKCAIGEKFKQVKFLKVKKEVLLNLDQFLESKNMEILFMAKDLQGRINLSESQNFETDQNGRNDYLQL